MRRSRTITLLAVLASLGLAAPAAAGAAPSAPAQEEYVLELPDPGNRGTARAGERADFDGDRGPARDAAEPETVSTITADASDDGSVIALVILAATGLAAVTVAIVKAAR